MLFAMWVSLDLVVASVSALNLALPDHAVDLDASTTSLTWIADAYTVALAAVGIALMGSDLGTSYASHLPRLSNLPAAARSAVVDSPAAGLEVASPIGGAAGGRLAHVVQGAFMNGLAASLLAACVVLAAAAEGTAFRAPRQGEHVAGPLDSAMDGPA